MHVRVFYSFSHVLLPLSRLLSSAPNILLLVLPLVLLLLLIIILRFSVFLVSAPLLSAPSSKYIIFAHNCDGPVNREPRM